MKTRVNRTMTIEKYSRSYTAAGTPRLIAAGETVAHAFEIEIDLDLLVQALGRKALANKTGVTYLQAGCIKVRALDRHHQAEPDPLIAAFAGLDALADPANAKIS